MSRCYFFIASIISFCAVYSVHARTIHNQTDMILYVAGYHTAKTAERKTNVMTIQAGGTVDIDVPSTGILSSKKRYIVVARAAEELAPTLTLAQLKTFPHKDLGTVASKGARIIGAGDFYLDDAEGPLKMYNQVEYSKVAKKAKRAGEAVKRGVVNALINPQELPEVKNNAHKNEVARVRVGNELPAGERTFLQKRMPKVKVALERMLGISLDGKKVPKIAVVLSGGSDRAMFASCGYIQGAQEIGLLDATTYIAALSGATWFLGSWFASQQPNMAIFGTSFMNKMSRGILSMTDQERNLLVKALALRFAYNEPLTTMDVFGGLLSNVLLDQFGDRRYMIYTSDQVALVQNGDWPLPIYTAVDGSKQTHPLHPWYECTPFEFGGAWLGHYIPTWSFGRKFSDGESQNDAPEINLGLMFGLYGSAFSVDPERIWQEALKISQRATVLEEVVRKAILNQIGDHRVTQSEVFNFTVAMPSSPLRDLDKMIFVDAGFAFGLPYPPVSGERPERAPDVLIIIESSENVGKIRADIEAGSSGLRSVAAYAKEKNLKFPVIDKLAANAVTVYKNEQDPRVPVVIWMPLIRDAAKWKQFGNNARFAPIANFEVDACIQKGFCPSVNFTYAPKQAQQLMALGQFNMYACRQDIIDAIKWKIEHM